MSPVDLVYGPMLIGVIFNSILYGIMVVQSFIYYQTYTQDKTWLRYFVLYLFLVETLNTGLDIGVIYQPLISQFGTMEALTYFPTLLASAPICTVMISTPIQIFTAWRIGIISQTAWIGIVISILAVLSLAGAFWAAIEVAIYRTFARKAELNTAGIVWFVSAAVADILITSSLIYTLTRRRTGWGTTDSAINRIIRLSVQTGFITSLFAIADLVSFCVSPHTAISFTWDFSLSKLYSNALLSTLNARLGWDKLNDKAPFQDNVLFGANTHELAKNSSDPVQSSLPVSALRFRGRDTGTNVASVMSQELQTHENGVDVEGQGNHHGDHVRFGIQKDADNMYHTTSRTTQPSYDSA